MGIQGLWQLLRSKGYSPRWKRPLSLQDAVSIYHVDLQGCFFSTIRYAYMTHPTEDAQRIVERRLKQMVPQSRSVIYLDGLQAVEKAGVHNHRRSLRRVALRAADANASRLQDRISRRARVKKHHFQSVYINLKKAFYWSLESRQSLATYLRSQGWQAIVCSTEADVRISADCGPGDIVVSGDSDLLIHRNVETVWRPMRTGFLAYNIADIQTTLGLDHTQWMALGIVSRNDYSKNVYGLGCATNYGIIKGLQGTSTEDVVEQYLRNNQVYQKNVNQNDFSVPMRVFLHGSQTPVSDASFVSVQEQDPLTFDTVLAKVETIRDLHAVARNEQRASQHPSRAEVPRHRKTQKFNRYRSIDSPPPKEEKWATEELGSSTTLAPPVNTPPSQLRYAIKKRSRKINHDPPPIMKQHAWKPPARPPDTPITPAQPKSNTVRTMAKLRNNCSKLPTLRALEWEHPTVTLDVGTLHANVKDALKDDNMANEVLEVIRQVVQLASNLKREFQHLFGRYLERIQQLGIFHQTDSEILDKICPRIEPKDAEAETEDDQGDGQGDNENDLEDHGDQFIAMFLRFLYSRKRPRQPIPDLRPGKGVPKKPKIEPHVNKFITRLVGLGLLEDPDLPLQQKTGPGSYPSTEITRSIASQLITELRRQYRRGSLELHEKLKLQQQKGILSSEIDIAIHQNVSSIENYFALVRASKFSRRMVSLSPVEHCFVSLSERELASVFWKRIPLRAELVRLAKTDFPNTPSERITLADVQNFIGSKEPGFLIKRFLSDIGQEGLTVRKRGKAGFKAAVKLMTLPEIRQHVNCLRDSAFNPAEYNQKGYILRGSIRTDGFRIQLLGFKLKELSSVRYRRLPSHTMETLPPQITSALGGIDYFLTEVRNVIKTPQDVERLWDCDPKQIKILGLDPGQAFVVGACALLPKYPQGTFFNLAVKQKAVYQPIFKHRRWMEEQKRTDANNGGKSIADLENDLPPLRGEDANWTLYCQSLEGMKVQLDEFYNGNKMRFKRHAWDAKRAKEEEFRTITDRLLSMVGGSIGRKRREDEKVVIAIGMGKFASKARLSSFHGSFQTYFVQKARALGYVVVGVNEFYTSKRCPGCEEFIGQVDMRRFYCKRCKSFMHRDVAAAHNICKAVQSHLLHQQRPIYLQPKDAEGRYLWMGDHSGSAISQTPEAMSTDPRSREAKRALSVEEEEEEDKEKEKASSHIEKRQRFAEASSSQTNFREAKKVLPVGEKGEEEAGDCEEEG